MKYILLLALFVSCTSPNKETAKSPSEDNAVTESESKPVSPYTVQPCYCMKIYKPVCGADGVTYGNSCEAECQGNKTWTEGTCGKTPKK